MTLDIGIASYENPEKLRETIKALSDKTKGDWRLLVVDNNSQDPLVKEYLEMFKNNDDRISVTYLDENIGYAGAMNVFFHWSTADYLAYCDNDAIVKTDNWNGILINQLEAHPEISMIFPVGNGTGSAYPIQRDGWIEILWGVGCFWMTRKEIVEKVGNFDTDLGHQEEVDYQIRIRMAGGHMAKENSVKIHHNQTSTVNPEAQERIGRGVKNWVNKWCRYFTGELVNYDSPNVLRFEDWPPTALYLEEFYLKEMPNLNDDPEVITIEGRTYDLLRVPRASFGIKGSIYRGRII